MVKQTVEKVPHVQGKRLESMVELIEDIVDKGECKWEKLCTAQYLPRLPGLGTKESGEDWKGLMSSCTSDLDKGPRYCWEKNSRSVMCLYSSTCVWMEGLSAGVYEMVMGWMPTLNSWYIWFRIAPYFARRLCLVRSSSHAFALCGVSVLLFLCLRALLSTVIWLSTTRALMVMTGCCAAMWALPVDAQNKPCRIDDAPLLVSMAPCFGTIP